MGLNASWGATQRDSSPLKEQGSAALAPWKYTLLLHAALWGLHMGPPKL